MTLFLALAAGPADPAAGAECVVRTAPLAFGVLAQLEVPAAGVPAGITVECRAVEGGGGAAGAVVIDYEISLGAGASGHTLDRAMLRLEGQGTLRYNLFLDAGHALVWGDGLNGATAGGQLVLTEGDFLSGTPRAATHLVHGRIDPESDAPPGTYADSVTVRLTF